MCWEKLTTRWVERVAYNSDADAYVDSDDLCIHSP